jgi:hypothetical protein
VRKLVKIPDRWDRPAIFLCLAGSACLAAGIAASGTAAAAFAGAGAALAGAAATRIGDLVSESRARAEREVSESQARAERDEASRSTDLDEGRRLAYMALMSKGAGNYALAASLLNALVYHQRQGTAKEAMKQLDALARGKDCDAAEEWLRGHIQRIDADLEAIGGAPSSSGRPAPHGVASSR